MIEIHIAVFLFGIAGLFGKLLNLSQTIIVFGRVVFASFALFLTLKISRIKLSLNKKMSLFLFFLGILLALHWMAFFHSIKISTVAIALLSYSSFPIFTVFLEPIIFRENFERKNLFLSILAFSGILILIPEFQIKNNITQGVIFGLLSGLTFSILSIFNRKLSKNHSSLLIAFYEDFFASLFLLPFFLLLKAKISSLYELTLLAILGIFCTAIAHSLFIKGMCYVKAQIASIVATLEPVYGIFLAFILLKETPPVRTLIGGLIIIFSAIVVSLRKK